MARTKQTAKNSTGGSAKGKLIGLPARSIRSGASRSRDASGFREASRSREASQPPPADVEMADAELADNWCHLCSDGSDLLVVCDSCSSATCKRCIPGLQKVLQPGAEDYTFKCVRCTGKEKIFHGLYDSSGSPVFPEGMEITANCPAFGHQQRINAPRLVIIELILDQLPHQGTAGQLLHLSLVQNYTMDPSRLHHELIFFDINKPSAVRSHAAEMAKVTRRLKAGGYDHAVVILHTHSADETGDLWFTSLDQDLGGPASAPIGLFTSLVFGTAMADYIKSMKFSAFFLLACGAVAKEGEALAGLQGAVKELDFTDSFAFGAERLITSNIVVWMISYAGQVIIGGQPSKDCITHLLYASSVGKHTSVVFINKVGSDGDATFGCTRYVWEHKSLKPNTHDFPLACPVCKHIYSWKMPRLTDGGPTKLVCTTKVGGARCHGTWEIPALPASSPTTAPYVGAWRKIEAE